MTNTVADSEDPILVAAKKVVTSNAWSTFPAFMGKLKKHLPGVTDPKTVVAALQAVPTDELSRKGIWICSFGAKYMPILLTNPAHRKSWESALAANPSAQAVCSCGATSNLTS